MKTKIDCIPCVFKQALVTVRLATTDLKVQERALKELAGFYSEKKLEGSPAEFSQFAYQIISEVTGIGDPFLAEKKKFNKLALSMVPECLNAIKTSDDKFATGAHLAVAGNIIDLGIGAGFDIHGTLKSALETPFVLNDLEKLRESLGNVKSLLYIGDNAGEIVFDRLFVEIIQNLFPDINVKFSVKSAPIINDATMEDAIDVGFDKVCEIIETGTDDIGAPLEKMSAGFLEEFNHTDLIIAKGHGNFETLNEVVGRNIFFILKAKCEVVAKELGVKVGDSVLKCSTQ